MSGFGVSAGPRHWQERSRLLPGMGSRRGQSQAALHPLRSLALASGGREGRRGNAGHRYFARPAGRQERGLAGSRGAGRERIGRRCGPTTTGFRADHRGRLVGLLADLLRAAATCYRYVRDWPVPGTALSVTAIRRRWRVTARRRSGSAARVNPKLASALLGHADCSPRSRSRGPYWPRMPVLVQAQPVPEPAEVLGITREPREIEREEHVPLVDGM